MLFLINKVIISLQDAPVIARAALLLECAFFVHRCNIGDWPMWIRGSHPSLAQRARSKGPTPTTTRRSLAAMHEAGLLFHSWGVAVGLKLEQMLKKKQNSDLPSIQEENERTFLAQLKEQIDEDYLDEGKTLMALFENQDLGCEVGKTFDCQALELRF